MISKNSDRHKRITKAIARYIALDLRPLNSVNDEGFFHLIKVLEPRYDLASRAHITDVLLPDMHMDLKARVKSELENASCVALTTDGWTSRATKSYNTITATIINDSWKLREFVLCTKEMPESHTAVNLALNFKHQTDHGDWIYQDV